MSTPLKVRRIRALRHKSEEFTALSLYFLGKNGIGMLAYAFVKYEIHLVESLKANLLIRNNIISPGNFVIDIKKKTTFIGS